LHRAGIYIPTSTRPKSLLQKTVQFHDLSIPFRNKNGHTIVCPLNFKQNYPLLLLFTLGQGNLGYLINFEFVAEEIVRTLVGSLGLVSAVPLTTAIAIFLALRADSLGKWEQVLGPVGGGDGGHVHNH
jgi:hypothetical protein